MSECAGIDIENYFNVTKHLSYSICFRDMNENLAVLMFVHDNIRKINLQTTNIARTNLRRYFNDQN